MTTAGSQTDSQGPGHPSYVASLTCPICREATQQELVRARVVLTLPVKGHPFHRAFGWADETIDRTKASPLHYGLCLCPLCGYPGLESDFRQGLALNHGSIRTLRKMFVEEQAGRRSPVPRILGPFPLELPEPERSIRMTLAAIRAEMLPYPELWRHRELGRLHLHLAWIYLDELHLNWEGARSSEPPRFEDEGPNAERLTECWQRLSPLKASWPDIPLREEAAREAALRYHKSVYQTRVEEPGPEEAVKQELQLAELLGFMGQMEAAKDMLERARATSISLRTEAMARQKSTFEDTTFSLADRRLLSARIQRLTAMTVEIGEQIKDIYGPPAGVKAVAGAGSRTAKAENKTAAKPEVKRRRFGIFG